MHAGTPAVQIIGSPRSGTSALSWALHAHPDFDASPESDFIWLLYGRGHLQRAYRQAAERPDDPWLAFHRMDFQEFCAHLGRGIDAVFASRAAGLRWVDSTPAHTLMLGELPLLLPKLKFLHVLRDGREVVASMLHSGFSEDWSEDFDVACRTWRHFALCGLEFELTYPERVLRVDHASLVFEPKEECARVLRFLESPHHDGPASFLSEQRVNSSYDNASSADVRMAKGTERLRRPAWLDWSEAERARFWDIAGDAMERLRLGWRLRSSEDLSSCEPASGA